MFHTVKPRDENDYNMNGCYKRFLQKIFDNNVKSVTFWCGTIGITGFDPKKQLKWH